MLISHYWRAFQGYRIWSRIDKKYHSPLYILMPKEKDEYNYYALKHLEQFIKKKNVGEVVLVTCDEEAIAAVDLFVSEYKVKTEYISRKEAMQLIKYYALNEFTSRITIISFTEPYSTHAENLLGVNGVTKEDLVCFDVYRFNETLKKPVIAYEGNEQKVIAFLERCEEK